MKHPLSKLGDYSAYVAVIRSNGGTPLSFRRWLEATQQ